MRRQLLANYIHFEELSLLYYLFYFVENFLILFLHAFTNLVAKIRVNHRLVIIDTLLFLKISSHLWQLWLFQMLIDRLHCCNLKQLITNLTTKKVLIDIIVAWYYFIFSILLNPNIKCVLRKKKRYFQQGTHQKLLKQIIH